MVIAVAYTLSRLSAEAAGGSSTPQTPSPTPSSTAGVGHAIGDSLNGMGLIWALLGAMLVALVALLIYGWPSKSNKSQSGNSVVRSWLAVSLTAGLLIFTAASFTGTDEGLQKMLVGAVITAVGGAGAFYFATKANESATSAILQAARGASATPPPSTLLLSKTADASALHSPVRSGDKITYHFKVTNNGTDALTDVTVSDTLAPPPASAFVWPGAAGRLKAGAVATATSTYAVKGKDLDADSVTASATATGKPPTGAVIRSEPEVTTTPLPKS